jgi:hypothetical protein
MTLSYAVVWHDPPRGARSGKLELAAAGLRLVGTGADGAQEVTEIPYRVLERARVSAPGERMGGRPTLVVERRDEGPIEIASVGGIGVVSELAEHLSRLLAPDARELGARRAHRDARDRLAPLRLTCGGAGGNIAFE